MVAVVVVVVVVVVVEVVVAVVVVVVVVVSQLWPNRNNRTKSVYFQTYSKVTFVCFLMT